MRILLTNDDGIRDPGIVALYDAPTAESPIAGHAGEIYSVDHHRIRCRRSAARQQSARDPC